MDYKNEPRLTIFPNGYAGNPIKKNDGTFVTNSKGEPVKHGELNGKINLPEGLPAGDYEVSIYKKEYTDKKTGESKTMYSGRIKKAYVKKVVDEHSRAKADAYVREDNSEIPF